MKPRTVMLTLELRDCRVRLEVLRKVRCLYAEAAHPNKNSARVLEIAVSQATATVAQPSARTTKATRRGRGK